MTPLFPLLARLAALAVCCGLGLSAASAQAQTHERPRPAVRHDLAVTLDPAAGKLLGRDELTLPRPAGDRLEFGLSPKAALSRVLVNDAPVAPRRQGEVVAVPLPEGKPGDPLRLIVEYAARFAGQPPADPTMDNPGQGVAASITAQGAFLLAGSLWYPVVTDAAEAFRLTVDAPKGFSAVAVGRLVEIAPGPAGTRTVYEAAFVPDGLALAAGPYAVTRDESGKIPLFTFFRRDDAALARTYLEASARHLRFFESLIGPYAFDKFAVVENFFETGFGFPSFTLLGPSVLRLPFIPETSLLHEIGHCWFGNGVLADVRHGNWSEGLTTYLADYLSKERESPQAGLDYRLQVLRDYATLAAGPDDLALKDFRSRTSPATRAVGYGKALFVFHMVRRMIGDEAFFAALGRVYADKLFLPAAWDDFRAAFVGPDFPEAFSRAFFDQWINRVGAPSLTLGDVSVTRDGEGYALRGTVSQTAPAYSLRLPVVATTDAGDVSAVAALDAQQGTFGLNTAARPRRVCLDPGTDVFRLLPAQAISASINSLKAARRLLAVRASGPDAPSAAAVAALLAGLGREDATQVPEAGLGQALAQAGGQASVLFLGCPQTAPGRELLATVPGEAASALCRPLSDWPQAADAVLAVGALPQADGRAGRAVATFRSSPGATSTGVEAAGAKATHYGRFGFLAFAQGRNVAKIAWPAPSEPLCRDLTEVP